MSGYKTIRMRIINKLHKLSGRQECEQGKAWVLFFYYILFPSKIKYLVPCKGYDPVTDVYFLFGCRFSGDLLRELCEASTPTKWFRVIKREHGLITIEYQPSVASKVRR
jgi:hypothetical protein